MITKKTARQKADRFAAALDGPLGRRAMQPVIGKFLPFFRELRSSGASWNQIAALLAAAGVRSASGQPLADSVLRAMVSRAERMTTASSGGEGEMTAADRQPPGHRARQRGTVSPRVATASRPRSDADHNALTDVAERIRRASSLRGRT